ncbi:MAG: VOC family protein [Dehalococcoidales bacterium]|nr:VOC family protein [Dehalococcoidales bacterium]
MKNDWEFDHVGLVVSDLDEILTYYPSLGIGVDIGPLSPNAVWPVPGSPEEESKPTTMTVYGKPHVPERHPVTGRVPVNRIIENIQMGNLVIECILGRPDGNGMNDDFFRDWGEGISHVCYNIPDPDGATDAMVKKGTGIIMSLESEGKIAENYVDTARYGAIWLSFRPPAGEAHKAWQAHNRAHPLTSKWKFYGVGVATGNIDEAVEYFTQLGVTEMGPEAVIDSSSSPEFKVHGLTGSAVNVRTRKAEIGSIVYELAQTLEKETTFGECLSKRGEGVYSLDFTVDNLEEETSRLVYRGVQVLFSGKSAEDKAFIYFDTRKVGNLMVKLIQA